MIVEWSSDARGRETERGDLFFSLPSFCERGVIVCVCMRGAKGENVCYVVCAQEIKRGNTE